MSAVRNTLRWLLARTPYAVVRRGFANRFQAIEPSLRSLAAMGYAPQRIVDGGAHQGEFALLAHRIFPQAKIDMIEPQGLCRPHLQALEKQFGFAFHDCALDTADGFAALAHESDDTDTGAHVTRLQEVPGRQVSRVTCRSLDSLFGDGLDRRMRSLLKLDLEGYELNALRGAARTLAQYEVVLLEITYFRTRPGPEYREIVDFLDDNGFKIFDIASNSGRPRDNRLRQSDLIFVHRLSPLFLDSAWV